MGQSNILEFLEQHQGEWFKTSEIYAVMGISQSNVAVAIRKLKRWHMVSCRMRAERYKMIERIDGTIRDPGNHLVWEYSVPVKE